MAFEGRRFRFTSLRKAIHELGESALSVVIHRAESANDTAEPKSDVMTISAMESNRLGFIASVQRIFMVISFRFVKL